MRTSRTFSRAIALSFVAIIPLTAQLRVDPRHTYHRVMAVVPIIGKGTAVDPRRPMYAPLPGQIAPSSRKGILAYTFVESDDGRLALAEFVAADPAEFHDIFADSSYLKTTEFFASLTTTSFHCFWSVFILS